jgi:hypothetical protein
MHAAQTTCADGCANTWDKCSGKGIEGVLQCCNDSDHCVKKNSHFSQCRPKSKTLPKWPDLEILTCRRAHPHSNESHFVHREVGKKLMRLVLPCNAAETAICAEGSTKTWKKCFGKGIDGVRPCMSDEDHCVFKNKYYGQCRPKSKPLPSWLDARVLTCEEVCKTP